MPYGIGAGGLLGVAIEVLPAPVQSALATATTGGTITAGTYRYVVTAINAVGETIASNEQSIVTTGSTSTVTVTWATVTGATGYKLYKTAAGGATGTELLYKTVGAVVTDIDTTPGSPVGAFPLANTAFDPGNYRAPTKFIPFNSESFAMTEATVFRRPIRQSADVIGAVAGNEHVEGDVEMEALEDCIPYWLLASRYTCVKTGTTPNWIYTFTPNSAAVSSRTLSVTIIRSDQVFGYVGVTTSSSRFGINEGMLTFAASLTARNEAVQATPGSVTWPTTAPFGAGTYTIEIPTGTTVTDTDTFEWSVENNAEMQFRLKSTGRGSDFTKYGERDLTISMERDFLTRADYDLFKSVTSQSITLTSSKGINNLITLFTPVAIKESYATNLSGQGDLVRGSITYRAMINGSGVAATITVKTQEDIAV
jgi:hypothetical protein